MLRLALALIFLACTSPGHGAHKSRAGVRRLSSEDYVSLKAVAMLLHGFSNPATGPHGESTSGRRAVASPGSVGLFSEGQNLDELFDVLEEPPAIGVVDLSSVKYTGATKRRGDVHRDGDWHRSIHLWVAVRRRNETSSSPDILFQKRALTKDTNPGLWDVSVAGHVDAGAVSQETVLREAEEELGLEVPSDQIKYLFTIAAEARGETDKHGKFICREIQDVYLYELEDTQLQALRYSTGEVEDMQALSLLEAIDVLRSQDAKYVERTAAYTNALEKGLAHYYSK